MQVACELKMAPEMLRIRSVAGWDSHYAIGTMCDLWAWVSLNGEPGPDPDWFLVYRSSKLDLQTGFDWITDRLFQTLVDVELVRETDIGLEFKEGLVLFGPGREVDDDPWVDVMGR